ncbi:hypothetical protein FSW04_04190 [Baekduia soli]|uniref:Uncharacterized protein n=1 Tax=Baekduia soli TaxID=496014 RepID=A0A5B8U1L8_9ACTN|nr:hypothetical protein [Baekduia soli]QEC46867.1 hypothetical protein FSW04_04190 [Baekduia soli]
MDRIEPIRPQPPAARPIPAIRRTARPGEESRPDPDEGRRRRRRPPPPPPQPPDDGRPHVDVTV